MVVQLEKREAMAKEAKIMERKKAQKSSKKLRQAATVRDKQSRNNRSGSSGECYALPSQFKCESRGVSSFLDLGGQVVHNAVRATPPLPGGAFYSAKIWVGNCPPCPPTTYAPVKYVMFLA